MGSFVLNDTVVLGDGTLGRLLDEWLAQYAALSDLGQVDAAQGHPPAIPDPCLVVVTRSLIFN